MKKLIRITSLILFIIGLGFFSYPIVIKESFDIQVNKAIEQFEQLKTSGIQTDNGDNTNDINNTIPNNNNNNNNNFPYAKLRKAMFEYNQELYQSGQIGLIDQLSYEKPDFLLSDYGIDSDVLGYITIPTIDVKLPIYNGASEENMTKGATYLANTSLPVGGKNTNCVIAAHTRYKGIHMFKRITELNMGDEIYITNFWETLVYKVVETKIIDPNDSQNIYIKADKSLVTLSTCYPYPDNYKRYLVYAEFVNN